ncbi:aspartoacylase [Pseudoalteromonas sp. MMG010]|uniref:aspartoacylase n=1 Tax=Pseudoalteromonas sp. MMG010 TaxID=2822685 RepID=UPI001B39D687|nr:aspartoacylase [Pseudoalteromonas sp. MMG010]MBQ4833622.1 aspartoacylase [Pseudoalteromonas sp. MMG010]
MTKIENVAVVGGTHGNEFSGIYLLKKWQASPQLLAKSNLTINTLFANPKSFEENKRYIDCDLNRQFTLPDLVNNTLANYEQSRAKVINAELGPKGGAKTDFIIDLHNTTSNMGPTLILLKSDDFNKKMGAYVLSVMPQAIIVFEDQVSMHDHTFLASIADQGVIVEIGPQPQSVIRQDVLDWMDTMTHAILDFVVMYNKSELPALPASYTAYKYVETIALPQNQQGERMGMVHKNVQDQDFKALNKGDPIFTLFDGSEITYQGDYQAYPHFINEAAYYDNNLAMSLGEKITVTL